MKGRCPVLSEQESSQGNFIQDVVDEDRRLGTYGGRVQTRFPPEPNGYLHIGHAKAICIDFQTAATNGGVCSLRFDDTNPTKEDVEYVDSIQEDIRWLGFDWGNRLFFASDYFDRLYEYALQLIRQGDAYVDDLSQEQIREYRGTLTEPGRESPYRDRPVSENLDLFARMRAGEFPNGARVLRAKIDMKSPNISMRDMVLYRIQHSAHHRTGDKWCIYPLYDYAHPVSDAIEGVTHSLCSLEFENNRAFYDWVLAKLGFKQPPKQLEFSRLNITHIITSKRRLRRLVEEGYVSGWDDPRMPTLGGMRRRGYTPEAIVEFINRNGVAKTNSLVSFAQLEHCIREDLNRHSERVMAVLRPLKVVITNYPEGRVEEFPVENNPEDPASGNRLVPFTRTLYIERDDFMEQPPKGFFRLAPGREVRLKGAYYITCQEFRRDPGTGEIAELLCTYDPESRGGETPDGRKVRGTLHWVSAEHARPAEVRLYDQLFLTEDPYQGEDYIANLNPRSLEVLKGCLVEPSLAGAAPGGRFQFLRHGYFCVDPDSTPERAVFNRTVSLRDTWAKVQGK